MPKYVLYFLDTEGESSSSLSAELTKLVHELSEGDRYLVFIRGTSALPHGIWFTFELIEPVDDEVIDDGPTH